LGAGQSCGPGHDQLGELPQLQFKGSGGGGR
jgi:hypothetical protein